VAGSHSSRIAALLLKSFDR